LPTTSQQATLKLDELVMHIL